MNDLLTLFARHGYTLLALIVFLEAIGIPVPAAAGLVAAGAACALHIMHPLPAVLVAIGAMVTGDWLMFIIGRYSGWALLGLLCRLSMNPETCILRSAESFYKRGKTTLVFAKFVPGVNTMAPPLAGSMRMRAVTFLHYDILGAALYILAYGAAGFVFSGLIREISQGLMAAGRVMEILVLLALVAYFAYRFWIYRKHRIYRVVPRVLVEELAERLQSAKERDNILLVDVRSYGYYSAGAQRIHGSIRIEPNHLNEEVKLLPKDKDIYLYCT
jgi:membrane protein DedA with SNARE-associated domain